MTQAEYQEAYTAIERGVEMGAMTWRQGMAKASLLALEYARAEVTAISKRADGYWRET